MKKFISVVGTRPNFVKAAPLCKAFSSNIKGVQHMLCHTGQHYDKNMSELFFSQLKLPIPDFYINSQTESQAEQTAIVMAEFEKILEKVKPDLVIVYGDVNSTLACSIVAAKMQIKIAHIEAGLRSFDMSMPEEINRIVTDRLSDILFVPEPSGLKNLKNEGVSDEKVFFSGNIVIDSLLAFDEAISNTFAFSKFGVSERGYILATFHRPSNVDVKDNLLKIINLVNELSERKTVVFPIHPRTKINLCNFGIENRFSKNIIITKPLGYLDFMNLQKNAFMILTDSGGIQVESTYYGVPCLTYRENTEWIASVEKGSNYLVGTNVNNVFEIAGEILAGKSKKPAIPELWDGKTADRIKDVLLQEMKL